MTVVFIFHKVLTCPKVELEGINIFELADKVMLPSVPLGVIVALVSKAIVLPLVIALSLKNGPPVNDKSERTQLEADSLVNCLGG